MLRLGCCLPPPIEVSGYAPALKTPKAVQVSGNTLQQVEIFKYLRVVFTSDGSRNKEIDTRIGKASAVLREFY